MPGRLGACAASAFIVAAAIPVWFASTASAVPATSLVWGADDAGQLGDGAAADHLSPEAFSLPAGVGVRQFAPGYNAATGLGTDGAVYSWGGGSSSPSALTLPSGITVTALASGEDHQLALTASGSVYASGSGTFGQLGDASTVDESTPVATVLPAGVTITKIAAGGQFSLAITSAGHVLAWGYDGAGQLGDGGNDDWTVPVETHLPPGKIATAIAAGTDHSLALTADGLVYAWGDNAHGELGDGTMFAGDGTTTGRTIPQKVVFPPGATIKAIAAGAEFSLALTTSGEVLAWGVNGEGELGDGTTADHYSPQPAHLPAGTVVSAIAAGGRGAYALTADGRLYAWGDGSAGQLGTGSTSSSNVPLLVPLPSGTRATSVAAGFEFAAVTTAGGPVSTPGSPVGTPGGPPATTPGARWPIELIVVVAAAVAAAAVLGIWLLRRRRGRRAKPASAAAKAVTIAIVAATLTTPVAAVEPRASGHISTASLDRPLHVSPSKLTAAAGCTLKRKPVLNNVPGEEFSIGVDYLSCSPRLTGTLSFDYLGANGGNYYHGTATLSLVPGFERGTADPTPPPVQLPPMAGPLQAAPVTFVDDTSSVTTSTDNICSSFPFETFLAPPALVQAHKQGVWYTRAGILRVTAGSLLCGLTLPVHYDCDNGPLAPPVLAVTGSPTTGQTVTYTFSCNRTTGAFPIDISDTLSGTLTYHQPPCPATQLTGPKWDTQSDAMKTALTSYFAALTRLGGCYVMTTGYRSKDEQQHIFDDWHAIADRQGPADQRTIPQVNGQLHGFANHVLGWNADGTARGGPARPGTSRHEFGEAADVTVTWQPFGSESANDKSDVGGLFTATLRSVTSTVGLCGPPDVDRVHVELPYKKKGEKEARCHYQ